MDNIFNKPLTRRDFIKIAVLTVAGTSLPAGTGCSSLPKFTEMQNFHREDILFVNCSLVDVKAGDIKNGVSILVRDGKIAAVGKISENIPPSAALFDLNNTYVIPGLIDSHAHTTLPGVVAFDLCDGLAPVKQMDFGYYNHIRCGTTTVRDMGAIPGILQREINKIEEGNIIGPRLVYCNRMLNINGSHPSIKAFDQGFIPGTLSLFTGAPAVNFKTFDELKEEIAKNRENGASFIKLTLDNKSVMCGRYDLPYYSDEMFRFIMDYAGKNNLPVAGHSQYIFGFQRAVKYQINSLEHLPSDGLISDEVAMQLVKNGTALIPTNTVGNLLAYPEWERFIPKEIMDDDFVRNEQKIRYEYLTGIAGEYAEKAIHETNNDYAQYYKKYTADEIRNKKIYVANPSLYFGMLYYGTRNLKKLKEMGALIGCGTDAGIGYDYQGTLWYEMAMMHRIGFKPLEVLRSATLNNAKILRMEDQIGSIEPKKLADIVVLEKNPLLDENISTFRTPLMTFKEGKLLFKRIELKHENNRISCA